MAFFKPTNTLEALYEEAYFRKLKPHQNVVDAVKHIIETNPDIEVFILSTYLIDSQFALVEATSQVKIMTYRSTLMQLLKQTQLYM